MVATAGTDRTAPPAAHPSLYDTLRWPGSGTGRWLSLPARLRRFNLAMGLLASSVVAVLE